MRVVASVIFWLSVAGVGLFVGVLLLAVRLVAGVDALSETNESGSSAVDRGGAS